MRRILLASIALLLAPVVRASADGISLEEYLKQSGIDPSEPAFVRLVRSDLPAGCDASPLVAFVQARDRGWSSLQRAEIARGTAAADGATQLEVVLERGKARRSTVALDSVGSIALMERLQADFLRIRLAPSCTGTAKIELRFHLPTAAGALRE